MRRHYALKHAVLVLLIAIVANRATACITTYTLTPTPPLTANWTDPSIWVPAGVPGSAAGDCVESGSATATTIVIDSVIPNAIEDLQWHCSGCVIEIAAGGQLTLQTSGLVDVGGGLVVSGGTFVVNAPGPSGLTFNGGTSLSLQSGAITVGGTISGSGTLTVDGGTLTLGGLAEVGNYTMTGGVLGGGGFLSAASTLTWSGGTLEGTGTTQIEGTGIGFFDGANGPMVLDGRPFDNYGTISYTAVANPLQLGNGAIFSNYGTFSIQDDGDITCDCTTPPLFRNSPNGQFYKGGGNATSTVDVPFVNDYGVAVYTGTLKFNRNGTHNGNFYGGGGTELLFTASHTFNNSSIYSDGNVSFVGGLAVVNSFFEVKGLTTLNGGSLTINSSSAKTTDFALVTGMLDVEDFTVSGSGTWSCGTIAGTSFTVASGATLTIDGANSDMLLAVGTFTNDGTIVYTATDLSGNWLTFDGGVLVNNGLFDIQGDAPIDVAAILIELSSRSAPLPPSNSIMNAGTFRKSIDTGTTLIVPDFFNTGTLAAQSGTMDFQNTLEQSAGSTSLEGGSIAGALDLNGGTLAGAGLFDGPVTNDGGEVAPGSPTTTGVIDMLDYTQGAGGTLSIKLEGSAAGQFDQVNADNVTLDGAFTATLLNGYEPPDGTTFDVLTFSTRSGSFGTQNLPVYQVPHGSIGSSYQAAAVQLLATVTPPSADLTIGMSGPATVDAGSPLSYVIVVGNSGPDGISSTITVANTLPAGATSASGSGAGWSCGAPIGGVITSTSSTPLPNGQSLPALTIAMIAPANAGSIQNAATASSSVPDPATPNNASVTTNVVAVSDLEITKNGPGGVTSGQNIVYTIAVTNNGPSQATGVSVSDPTPANATFVSNSGACTTAFPCAIGTLNAGQTATITSTFSTSPSFAGNVTNTASVSSATSDPNNGDNSATKITNVGAQADLSITKSGPASANPGDTVTYTVTVTNNGPSPATNVTVADVTPVGIAFLSNSGACASPYPCGLGTLASGQSAAITSTYSIPTNYAGASVVNSATASSDVNDPSAGDNTAAATTTVTPAAQADLTVDKTGPSSVATGQLIVYTITVENLGPSAASGVSVTDPTPAGLVFVSNGGACATAFPCALGTLSSGQSATITSTFQVPPGFAGATITNTASVNSATLDLTPGNNTSTVVTPVTTGGAIADLSIVKQGPFAVTSSSTASFSLTIRNNGPSVATSVTVNDPTPAGLTFLSSSGACPSGFPCTIPALNPGQTVVAEASYRVQAPPGATITNTASISSAATDPNSANDTSSATIEIVAATVCPQSAPSLLGPAGNATVSTPVTLSWSAIAGAAQYVVTIDGPEPMTVIVSATETNVSLAPGSYTWTVGAMGNDCPILTSASSSFVVCGASLQAPAAGAIAETTTGQTYSVSWNPISGAPQYELQQSTDAEFTAPQGFLQSETTRSFTKAAVTPTAFYYRVRALPECGSPGTFSPVVRVVVVPVPSPTTANFNVNVPATSTTPVTFRIFVPGLPEGSTTFVATADKPWLTVLPTSGIVPPEGVLLTIAADPSGLVNGTWTGTILVVYGSVNVAGSVAAQANAPTFSIPVSISLVTPIVPGAFSEPSSGALIIPAVGHLSGVDSTWRSDVRIANTSTNAANYRLRFNMGSGDASALLSSTVITVEAGSTIALDNLVRAWFGTGSLGESSNGALIIEPLDADGIATPVLSPTTSVSSRTFNASANGTFGQFIPALPFASFIARAFGDGGAAPTLSLQQISQSSALRTNLGLLEASGRPVSALVSVFNDAGLKIFDLPLQLSGGQQQQLNSFLANNGITLPSGRIEARVIEGEGKVTAYASVVDNVTNDPYLVFGVPLGGAGANRSVLPGVADLETGVATWRSDVRLFNAGSAPQLATLTFYPTGEPANSSSREISIAPGEVKALDGVLRSLFGLTNVGGALHVTTPDAAPLIVSARTFDQHPGGTVGQFVPAVAPNEAVGVGERALQVLQAEESIRYRTNLGIAEVSGHTSVVEIEVNLPDSKVRPVVTIPLAANEFRQFPILSNFGLGAVYNARITIRVVEGAGRVTAYGSVIDRITGDPTYIPPQ